MGLLLKPESVEATDNQIRALRAILPYDTEEDRQEHKTALLELITHRQALVKEKWF